MLLLGVGVLGAAGVWSLALFKYLRWILDTEKGETHTNAL